MDAQTRRRERRAEKQAQWKAANPLLVGVSAKPVSKEAMNSLHLSEITASNKDSNLSSMGITANHLWILTTIYPLRQ